MSNQAFYLKYRPQKISELDNDEVSEKISAFLKSGNIPHAFLLVGYKGTGKTSSARLIAKAVNCEKNAFSVGKSKEDTKTRRHEDKETIMSYEPCNECSLCRSVTMGNNPDVLEIDAASNTSVDDIRDLRDKVNLSPMISRYKVYIIDEVHMISKSAFNALLKTLEEPPEKVIFILATTEMEKVPDTIVSRCATIVFKKANEKSAIKSLRRIVKGEKIKVGEDVLASIAEFADGSFRDGAKILEQAVSLSTGEITEEILKKVTGSQGTDATKRFIDLIFEKNTKESIEMVEDLKNKNVDLQVFLKAILYKLHEIFLFKVGVDSLLEEVEKKLIDSVEIERLKQVIEFLEKAYLEMKRSDMPELPLEIALYEISNINNQISRSQDFKEEIPNSKFPARNASHSEAGGQNSKISINPLEIRENPSASMLGNEDVWKKLISRVNTESKQLAGIMRSCKLDQKAKNEFEIVAPSKFHLDRLNDVKNKDLIQNLALEIIGENVRIKAILIEK